MLVYVKVIVIVLGLFILSSSIGFVFVSNLRNYVVRFFIKLGIIFNDVLNRFVNCR